MATPIEQSEFFPREIAARTLGISLEQVRSAERIKHGLTNDSWRVATARGAVIVRLSNTAEDALQIDRHSEARVLAIVADAGLGPEVLACDPANHLLVTRDAGSTWSDTDAQSSANIQRIGELLRRLHALPMPLGVRRVDLLATVRGYLRELEHAGRAPKLTAAAIRERAEYAALALRQDARECLCHNDVHSLNIVDDGTLRLLDWEYSGIGQPMFDLASICAYHRYDRAQRERLLDAYLASPLVNAASQLDLACWLFEYVRELWLAVRANVAQ